MTNFGKGILGMLLLILAIGCLVAPAKAEPEIADETTPFYLDLLVGQGKEISFEDVRGSVFREVVDYELQQGGI